MKTLLQFMECLPVPNFIIWSLSLAHEGVYTSYWNEMNSNWT